MKSKETVCVIPSLHALLKTLLDVDETGSICILMYIYMQAENKEYIPCGMGSTVALLHHSTVAVSLFHRSTVARCGSLACG